MTQPVRSLSEHPVPKIINLVGPTVIIALAATFFVSDFAFKNTIGSHYRVSASVIDSSLQTSMAEGFITLIGGTVLLLKIYLVWQNLLIGVVSFVIAGGLAYIIYLRLGKQRTMQYLSKAQAVNSRALIGGAILLAIGLGVATGDLAAKSTFKGIDGAISSGCHGCSLYRTRTGNFTGATIFADKQRIVLAQVDGVRLIKVDDIAAIVRAP